MPSIRLRADSALPTLSIGQKSLPIAAAAPMVATVAKAESAFPMEAPDATNLSPSKIKFGGAEETLRFWPAIRASTTFFNRAAR